MKTLSAFIIILICVISGFRPAQVDNIEFVCAKTHKASNTCYFNFIVDGGKYTYTDIGCKKSKNKEEIIKKVKEGKLALAKDWKIACPAPKQ